MSFITELQSVFQENADFERAEKQAKYMKNKFVFFGLPSPVRKKLQAPFLVKKYLPQKKEAFKICRELYQKPQREFHYFSVELLEKYQKQIEEKDIELFEYLITHNSWWDTVDFIAVNLVGNYFKKFPKKKEHYINKWLQSNNLWLQRTCLIFQLKYKSDTDTELLAYSIQKLLNTKEFFINKAIGWALRQYTRINSNWVIDFVENTPNLSNLSKKEALRLLN
jgi:3-methyladenine DNA glycosylase AlkD